MAIKRCGLLAGIFIVVAKTMFYKAVFGLGLLVAVVGGLEAVMG